jgi:hypothetical protein
LYSCPNKFPHSSPEAPRIIQIHETSTSEGGNYPPILPVGLNLQESLWDFLHAAKLGHGTCYFTSPSKEGILTIIRMPGLNPGIRVPVTSMLTTRPPKPSCQVKVASGFVNLNKLGWRARVRIPARQKIFSSPRPSDHPWDPLIILLNGYWAHFPKPGHGADHPPPTNADVKNMWSHTSSSHLALHCEDKNNFTVYAYQGCF